MINICSPANNFTLSQVCSSIYEGAKGYQMAPDGSSCFPMTDRGSKDISLSLLDPTNPSLHYVVRS
jgi:hypothetical protein